MKRTRKLGYIRKRVKEGKNDEKEKRKNRNKMKIKRKTRQ